MNPTELGGAAVEGTAGEPRSGSDAPRTVLRAEWVLPMMDQAMTDQAVTDQGMRGPGGSGAEPVIHDGAVCFAGDSILEVGPAQEVLAGSPGARVTHLRGHALLPAFVNAHTHLPMTMFRGVADDRGLEEFLATLLPLEGRSLDERRVGLASWCAMVESHRAGVNTALDMYFFSDAVLAAADRLGFRVLTGPVFLDDPGPDSDAAAFERRLAAAAEWLARHPDSPDRLPVVAPHSTYLVSPSSLGAIGELARDAGALLHIHASETQAEVREVTDRHGLSPVALLDDLGLLGPRTVVAHAVHLDRGEIEALARSGASVAHCPASNLKLGSGVAPVAELLEAGVEVALGTDGPASSNDLDVMGAMRLASLLHKSAGARGTDPTVLPARAALKMVTRNGARALGLGGRLGVLAPGASADMIAVDLDQPHTQPVHDVFSALVYSAGRGDITEVWSSGHHVVSGGRHTVADESEVGAVLRSLGAEILTDPTGP